MIRADYYVYVLFRPTGVPCYVGKGRGDRWLNHERPSRKTKINSHLARIIAKAAGELPKIKIREGLTNAEACEIEIALIAAIGRGKNGPLVNHTDGGEGTVGFRPKLSHEHRTKIGDGNRGKKRSDSTKAKLRAINIGNQNRRGKKCTDEAKVRMSAIQKVIKRDHPRRLSPIERVRLSLRFRGRTPGFTHSEITRAKMRASMLARGASNRLDDQKYQSAGALEWL